MKFTLLITLAFCIAACNGSTLKKGKLIWSDDFDYSGQPADTYWEQQNIDGATAGNNEKQWCTNDGKNAHVSKDALTITAKKEEYNGRQYTSARLRSKQAFKYGTFEMRAKLPSGQGAWSAFWLFHTEPYSFPTKGEIDIMENFQKSNEENNVQSAIHTAKYSHITHNEKKSKVHVEDLHNTFHTYALDWTPTSIKGYVDGRSFFTYKKVESSYSAWPFDDYFNIILNLAIGGNPFSEPVIDDAAFPKHYTISYVRVYNNSHSQLLYPTIKWEPDWTKDCGLNGKDLRNERTPADQCSATCRKTSGCTHFMWTDYDGGTCWMKQGGASKSEAFYINGAVCGFASEAPTTGKGKGGRGSKGGKGGRGSKGGKGGRGSKGGKGGSGSKGGKGGSGSKGGKGGSGGISADYEWLEKGEVLWSYDFNKLSEDWLQANNSLGDGVNGKQFYTNAERNLQVINNRQLVIIGKKDNYKTGGKNYTSARIVSQRAFKYGTFEMTAKLPKGGAVSSVFSLIPENAYYTSGSYDKHITIMENENEKKSVMAGVNYIEYSHNKSSGVVTNFEAAYGFAQIEDDPHNTFHSYAIDWTPTYIKCYFNGLNYFTYTKKESWPFDAFFNININMAIGGHVPGTIDDSAFPLNFTIGSLTVYDNGYVTRAG